MVQLYKKIIIAGLSIFLLGVGIALSAETKAKRIRTTDLGGYYATGNVEGNLQEIGATTASLSGLYLQLDGSNANTTIDIGSEDLTTTGNLYADRFRSPTDISSFIDYDGVVNNAQMLLQASNGIYFNGSAGGLYTYTDFNVNGNSIVAAYNVTSDTFTDGTLVITGGDLSTTGTAYLGLIDLGTNTIDDTSITGDWAFNSGNLSGIGTLGAGAITGTSVTTGLTTDLGVYTTTGGLLTTTIPSSGDLGFWNRTGTVLTPVTAGDNLDTTGTAQIDGTISTNAGINISGAATNTRAIELNTTGTATGSTNPRGLHLLPAYELGVDAGNKWTGSLNSVYGYTAVEGIHIGNASIYALDFGNYLGTNSTVGSATLSLIGTNTFAAWGYSSHITCKNAIGMKARAAQALPASFTAIEYTAGLYAAADNIGTITNPREYPLYVEKPTKATKRYQVALAGNGVGTGVHFGINAPQTATTNHARIYAPSASQLNLALDVSGTEADIIELTSSLITLNKETLFKDKAYFTQSDGNEYIDSLADGYMDYRATTAHRFGDGTNETQFLADGDLVFVGTAGLSFAEIYGADTSTTIAISITGKANKVQITSFTVDGVNNNMTPNHTNDHITVVKAGMYLCTVSIHAESTGGGGADNYGYSVYKNNGATEFANLHGQRNLTGGGGDEGSMSLSGIIDLAVDDTIEVWLWNNTNADDIIIDDINLSLTMIGGT